MMKLIDSEDGCKIVHCDYCLFSTVSTLKSVWFVIAICSIQPSVNVLRKNGDSVHFH